MLGDRRPFPIMLVVPNADVLRDWGASHGVTEETVEALLRRAEVRGAVEREVRKTLRDLAQFEMPKKFLLVPRDFSVEAGELTPTLKVRRRIVEERHRAAIEALYAESHVT
jgi:long-chain acyl-CoA synthetase